jgi:hypothetical protein
MVDQSLTAVRSQFVIRKASSEELSDRNTLIVALSEDPNGEGDGLQAQLRISQGACYETAAHDCLPCRQSLSTPNNTCQDRAHNPVPGPVGSGAAFA